MYRKLLWLGMWAMMIELTMSTTYSSISLLNTSQYHFIPNGSYLQFSLSSAALDYDSQESFTKISGLINITIMTTKQHNIFNLAILPPSAPNSTSLYNCYMRAAYEGIQSKICHFDELIDTDGNCSSCAQGAVFSDKVIACAGCSTEILFRVYSDEEQLPRGPLQNPNATLILIIDNTDVIAHTEGYLEIELGYHVWMDISASKQALLELFLIIITAGVVICIILCSILKCRIHFYEEKIRKYKEKAQ